MNKIYLLPITALILCACGFILDPLHSLRGSFNLSARSPASDVVPLSELAWLPGIWKRVDQSGDAWIVPPPSQLVDFKQIFMRDVREEGDLFPVYCQYTYYTAEMPIITYSPNDRTHYVVAYTVSDVQLTLNPLNGPSCPVFIQRQLEQVLTSSLHMKFTIYHDENDRLIMEELEVFERQVNTDNLLSKASTYR